MNYVLNVSYSRRQYCLFKQFALRSLVGRNFATRESIFNICAILLEKFKYRAFRVEAQNFDVSHWKIIKYFLVKHEETNYVKWIETVQVFSLYFNSFDNLDIYHMWGKRFIKVHYSLYWSQRPLDIDTTIK